MSTDDPLTRMLVDRKPDNDLTKAIAARVAYGKLSRREQRRTPPPAGYKCGWR
jgi:hypothetical protein